MRIVFYIVLLCALLGQISVYGQEISDDSLMKKANQEIYNNPDNAIRIGQKLIQKEKDINKSITIYLLISTANIAKRDFDESLRYILMAKELAQKTNDLKTQTNVLVLIAIQYQQMELFSKSLETLDEAEESLMKVPESASFKHFEMARSYAVRGMIYKSQSNPEIALEKFKISIKNFEKIKEKKETYYNQSIVYYNIGYCYLILNQTEKARPAFMKSIYFAKLIKAKSLEAFTLKGLAEMHKQKHQNQKALNLLKEAEILCQGTGDLTLKEGIYKEIADNYLSMGNQNLYQVYCKKYFEMRFQREQNELVSINRSINNQDMEMLKKSHEIDTRYRYFSIVVAVFGSLVFALFLYFTLKIRRKNKKYHKEIQELIRS